MAGFGRSPTGVLIVEPLDGLVLAGQRPSRLPLTGSAS
jgi:hypothetical protein